MPTPIVAPTASLSSLRSCSGREQVAGSELNIAKFCRPWAWGPASDRCLTRSCIEVPSEAGHIRLMARSWRVRVRPQSYAIVRRVADLPFLFVEVR